MAAPQPRTMRNLLTDPIILPTLSPNARASTSRAIKPFAERMSDVRFYTMPPFPAEEYDDERLNRTTHIMPFPPRAETIASEGDVTRLYHDRLASQVMATMNGLPLYQRNQIGPLGNTQFAGTVDCMIAWKTRCVIVGDLKAPNTITLDWGRPQDISTEKEKLGKELRAYAHYYDCPQIFCYDGLHLLLISFLATSQLDIKTCQAECWLVSMHGLQQYALYLLVSRGIRRCASLDLSQPVRVGLKERFYQYHDGKPYWGESGLINVAPTGYTRSFDAGTKSWAWYMNGNFIMYDTASYDT